MSFANTSQSPRSPQQTPEQELRAAYRELEEALQNHKLELPAELSKGNIEAADLANESLSTALQRFRDVEARMNYTHEDGRPICRRDYHGLKQLADGNGLPLEDVLSGCREINDGRVLDLCLGDKRLAKLDGIEYLTELHKLSLIKSQISDIEPLRGLTALQKLTLYDNQIADTDPLTGLAVLKLLGLGHNRIADIGPLAGLNALQSLGLEGNKIADIGSLAGLAALQWLDLDRNKVADIDSLVGLNALQWLFLQGLPHTEAISRTINELKKRGVNVAL